MEGGREWEREWKETEGMKGVDGTEKGGKGSYGRDYSDMSFIQRSTVRFSSATVSNVNLRV